MKSADDDFRMEAQPILKIVEIDGVENLAFVWDAVGSKDRRTGGVVVVVSDDGGVEFGDRTGIKRAAGLRENPGFALGIGRLFGGDELGERGGIDAKAGEHHRVITAAQSRIVRVELAGGSERGFEPQAREVEDAEGAGSAGTD